MIHLQAGDTITSNGLLVDSNRKETDQLIHIRTMTYYYYFILQCTHVIKESYTVIVGNENVQILIVMYDIINSMVKKINPIKQESIVHTN